ncbi:hypothetical protein A2U01_0111668, partial [Trifolium medium]|nr:hypothetical protein [Trifolium medium]
MTIDKDRHLSSSKDNSFTQYLTGAGFRLSEVRNHDCMQSGG